MKLTSFAGLAMSLKGTGMPLIVEDGEEDWGLSSQGRLVEKKAVDVGWWRARGASRCLWTASQLRFQSVGLVFVRLSKGKSRSVLRQHRSSNQRAF